MISSKPYQYINGWVEFYKLKFKVTPDVLIPRPETELLVDEVLNILRSERSESRSYLKNIIVSKESSRIHSNNNKRITILDLGTGAGNIAISIAKNSPRTKIIATDISSKALKIAKQNAKLHGVDNRIKFIKSDLLSALNYTLSPKPYTLIIVTNLPYIPSARIPYLDPSVKDFEPYVALNGGKDGFELYRKLFQQIKKKGWTPKLIIGEIDYTHGELAINEAQKYFSYSQIEVKNDLTRKQRILLIRRSHKSCLND